MFIVIEGLDGAGKSTQVKLIRDELNNRGINSEYIHFPRFDSPLYGDLIARFLRGELGELDSVNPYLVALLYAGDRASASDQITQWLKEGKYVIVDRYVYSNIAYQCAKIDNDKDRLTLRNWILDAEYSKNNIIKPDISLFLDVPFKFTKEKLTQEREGNDRDYLNGARDIHEESLSLQERVREVYLSESNIDNKSLIVVKCSTEDGDMLPAADIFEKISNLILKN